MEPHHIKLPDGSYPWFDFGNGDYAGWLPSGDAFMFDHESGNVSESEFPALCELLYSQLNRSAFDDRFD